jgi:hypothetical protein
VEPPIWVALERRADTAGGAEVPLSLADSAEPTTVIDLLGPGGTGQPRESAPAAPRKVADPVTLATLVACRDDGTTAVWLGRLVRGQFVPLPPAIAGLAATAFLAWLGMRNLPGILLLTPVVVMLLAAPGSSHPHDKRLDWLTPAVLLAGQLVYIAAIGFAFSVPAPVTFGLCGLIALRQVELAWRGRYGPGLRSREGPDPSRPADTRLGWEGRMLIVGVGAMVGIALVAYVALAAYLVVLIFAKVTTSYVAVREGELR